MDVEILSSIITQLCCPVCKRDGLKLLLNFKKKKGISSHLAVSCECGYLSEFDTSKQCGIGYHDINIRRTAYTMRSCGQGYSGILCYDGLSRPMTEKNYDSIIILLLNLAKLVAEETMCDADDEIRKKFSSDPSEIVDTRVSSDGS